MSTTKEYSFIGDASHSNHSVPITSTATSTLKSDTNAIFSISGSLNDSTSSTSLLRVDEILNGTGVNLSSTAKSAIADSSTKKVRREWTDRTTQAMDNLRQKPDAATASTSVVDDALQATTKASREETIASSLRNLNVSSTNEKKLENHSAETSSNFPFTSARTYEGGHFRVTTSLTTRSHVDSTSATTSTFSREDLSPTNNVSFNGTPASHWWKDRSAIRNSSLARFGWSLSSVFMKTTRTQEQMTMASLSDKVDDGVDYLADVYDVFTDDYVTTTTENKSRPESNATLEADISSLRQKFNRTFANLTSSPAEEIISRPATQTFERTSENIAKSNFKRTDYGRVATTSVTEAYSSTDNPFASASTTYPGLGITPSSNVSVVTNGRGSFDKEQLQLPGITLKVSHVLIPKQKRSRYNIRNMRIELPKGEMSTNSGSSSPGFTKSSKNSNCTRFPVQVVTASADGNSSGKVNLTEERYDCEFSSEIRGAAIQKQTLDSIRTYFGGYVFRYTIPKVSANVISVNQSSTDITKALTDTTTTTITTSSTVNAIAAAVIDENDDYFSEYTDSVANGNGSGKCFL